MAEHPVAGVDYPTRWRVLLAWFPADAYCFTYLERLRTPPSCAGSLRSRGSEGHTPFPPKRL